MSEENQRPPLRRRSSSRLSLSDRDIEDDSDASDEDNINEEERIEILHQLQVQSARKFLWDEDEDESHDDIAALGTSPRRNISHGSSSRFVLPSTIGASFVWNSQEEIDLEGHLGAKRHDIIETKKRAGFLDRIFLSRGRSDRLGLHSAYAKSTQPRNGLFQNICLCIQGFFMFVGGCLFGARHTKRNFCIFFILAALATGLFFAVRSDGSDASYLREPTSTLAPTSNPTKAPEPVVTLPVPQGIAVPTAAPKHNVIGISDGDSVVGTPQGETVIDTHIAAFKDFLKEEGIYDQDRFNDINSPQYKALHWIVKVDPERMPPSTETFVLQRYALATLFFALSGAELSHPGQSAPQTGWKDQTGWMTGAGYCSWYGVHCITGDGSFDNSHVISVNLTANGLQGQIPPEVRFLSSLDHLDLSQNEINETIPVELGSMTGLRTLFLRENKLTGSIPSEFGQLSSLKNLDLSGNDLKGQIPSEIGYCTELRALVTDMNPRITGHIPPLSRLADLEVLSFKHNTLDGTIPDWLYDLTNLRQVRFQRNALTGKVSPKLANLSNLRFLQLSQNSFTGEFPDVMGHHRYLVVLDLVMNQFEGELPSSFTTLPRLERLLLEGNRFSGEIPKTISHLKSLKHLYIQKNEFISTIPDVFGSLINLELFDVQENHLTGGIPPSLSSCTNLLSLKVEGNQLSAPIPTSLGSLTNLEVFNLFANNFSGSMPEEICALRSDAGRLEYLAADCNGIDFSCSCCTKCL